MKSTVTIFHNPRCSKSRAALELLQSKGITPEIVEYLKTPLKKNELAELVKKLKIRPAELVRTGEDIYKAKYRGKELSDEQWLAAMAADPVLMERPVVVKGTRAVVGRPPEKVLELI